MVDHPEILFTQLFIKGILDESDTTFLKVLMENQIEGWPAQASIYFLEARKIKYATLHKPILQHKLLKIREEL